ncbi:ABC transporter transmembrane region [Ruminiclostridium papyrosolvens DSM 2782]|uniref:ABC transporter transmembrane region n=1 Tax=Ruminiclostridium papyrosolvens DSM 2782 TaxID=588581 RepID=F1TER6_9FIRM|nr:ABC transporter ATP-binding protein [Ruminiclostridium papyrosolvens]EGD47232.1 ABC transporter transmembrane region [Ruminiclostridium papyrosolvens DSM 2782]WES36271.1 ABC transporter ATP-binding protein [Ruminiclostridium papyrosolvens DSM 2782]
MNIYRKYFKKYRVMFLTAVSCVFFEAICDLLQPAIMSRIIDNGIKNSRVDSVLKLGLLMLIITLCGAGFAATRNILASKVSQRFGADLRYDVFSKIMKFSEESVDKIESGSLITRMTNDTSQIMQFVNGMMRIFFKAPLTCMGSIILAVILSPFMSIVLFCAIAIIAILIVISMKMSYSRFAKVQTAIDRLNTTVQEYLLGIRLVKAFGRFSDEEEKFSAVNTDLFQKSVSSQLVVSYFSPLMSLTISTGIALIIYLGSILFGKGYIEVGKVAAFINYMMQILTSLIMITNIFNTFIRTKASTQRVVEVLESQEDFSGFDNEEVISESSLEFKNVTFAYPDGSGLPALKNLSFRVNEGETLAIIGPTGSGKSTVAWLCLRFYDVPEGSIYINDKDIRELATNYIRNNIALAPQKSMLFTGTVFDNIVWGMQEENSEKMLNAAKQAQADEFVQKMSNGYDSLLGQNGVNLSGGQKQRLSIARALAKDSPIMILDDCTSALDAVTEAKVRRALRDTEAKKTIIMITQRIGTAMTADKILVMDNGINAGFGSHKELLSTCKTYREIYDSQIGGDL